MDYGIAVRSAAPMAETVERVRTALADQGFGVLTEIDVQATLKAKLGQESEPYLILGACNPQLAHQALGVDRRIGLLLPCNVVVRVDGESTMVEALDPQVIVSVPEDSRLQPIADEAGRRLRAALQAVGER
ncbi:DUF302 domain-containing protein [Amycolatopsis roodepoortensis]|uniref:DUF302 domain-containing protein n=1 Tax=Amycolatopsis roodepoortensis TaxID=700274 RepID=UPI00214C86BB|nr:DUF302 domain-containing protein [Amycolatopsis roodepoortensis]UUV28663.1 DUF302 domain-containing protein [Amycolatopsis roodepoortensis]